MPPVCNADIRFHLVSGIVLTNFLARANLIQFMFRCVGTCPMHSGNFNNSQVPINTIKGLWEAFWIDAQVPSVGQPRYPGAMTHSQMATFCISQAVGFTHTADLFNPEDGNRCAQVTDLSTDTCWVVQTNCYKPANT